MKRMIHNTIKEIHTENIQQCKEVSERRETMRVACNGKESVLPRLPNNHRRQSVLHPQEMKPDLQIENRESTVLFPLD